MRKIIEKVGHDAEFMVSINGTIEPIVGKLGGTKERPIYIPELEGAYQEDCTNAEIGIIPADRPSDWIRRTLGMVARVEEVVHGKAVFIPSYNFPINKLRTKQAREAGCSVDFNVYSGRVNPRPEVSKGTLRSAGGHIHMQVARGNDIERVVRAADVLIGTQMVVWDTDINRRSLYGQAGAFRPKNYGVEYRTPSNAWMQDEEKMEWVFEQAMKCGEFDLDSFYQDFPEGEVIRCINDSDIETAMEIRAWLNT
jgi:hypothetical protein